MLSRRSRRKFFAGFGFIVRNVAEGSLKSQKAQARLASSCAFVLAAISYERSYFLPPLPPFPFLPPFPLPFFFFLFGGTIPRAMMRAFNSSTAQYFLRMI